ncbi:ABC transporter permease [Aureimonas phyllosphaerae]|uniref:ABC-type transport system involved in multi-copper enzyme maturation permease subunit n=1 Tax=Aureimonas phyllosphaerae TaxID=1166078 RepID=A0A7W6BXL4_9HYPH|nr:hypothetical protein [Aureimonas phyllosphaerae]MBB3937959.1 ABC-type transport system involved in multi-copper enzyme maturation permease subunit [Aureimonas phyllosphaerae]MBB3961996.1 ABC-type transport system involved in multi-copper enzyme maturation permease subunit [Aureimonas phyllosphaerae]SFF52669.1 ABC-type transport system involved in multi-copper enzyme maturation, permease component [Aureimonas phyllosphaerae]
MGAMNSDILVVAGFELRQQFRSHVFRVVFAISTVMVFGAMIVDELRVGMGDEILRNSASVIVQTHLVWTLFYMFTAAAFVADAVLRDEQTGFAPIIRSAPIGITSYLIGRFAGAFLSVLVCFASVPAAILLANVVPGLDPATFGPPRPDAYAFAFFLMAVPNLFLVSAVSFGLTTATRSMTGALMGALALLVLYGLGVSGGTQLIGPMMEPFGFLAYAQTAAVANTPGGIPAIDGALLDNRLLWLGVGVGLLVLSLAVTRRRLSSRFHPAPHPRAANRAATATHRLELPAAIPQQGPAPIGWRTAAAQFAARTRWEIQAIVLSPVLAILLTLGGVNAGAALLAIGSQSPEPLDVATVTATLLQAFRLLPTTIILFFAGELMWREREQGVDDLIGTAPIPAAAIVLPKLLALLAVLAALSAAGGALGAVALLADGGAPRNVLPLFWIWMLPSTFEWSLVAVLAVFLQALSPSKVAGWGWLVLFLIASLTLDRLGLTDPLYRYGRYPGWPLSAGVSGEPSVSLYRAYWTACAVMLLAAILLLTGRIGGEPLAPRLKRLPARARSVAGAALLVSTLAFAGLALYLGHVV